MAPAQPTMAMCFEHRLGIGKPCDSPSKTSKSLFHRKSSETSVTKPGYEGVLIQSYRRRKNPSQLVLRPLRLSAPA